MASFSKQRLMRLERESIISFQTECKEMINELLNCLLKILSNEERRVLAEHLRTIEDSNHFLTLTGVYKVDEIIEKIYANADANNIIEELRPRLMKARYIPAPPFMADDK